MSHFARLSIALASLALLAMLLVPAAPARAADERCFAETNLCISGRIRAFWEQNGGLPIFGAPIAPQQEEQVEGQALQVQWFERNRLELHPDNARPYDVLLGRLGVSLLEQQGRDWFAFPKSQAQPDCRFFPETGHNICGDILKSWRARGLEIDGRKGFSEQENLALFGLPLSDAQTETIEGKPYTIQWFERARFELHPENQAPYNVLLGLLGSASHSPAASSPPAPPAMYDGYWDGTTSQGATISFTVSGNALIYMDIKIRCGSDDSSFTASAAKVPINGNAFLIKNSIFAVAGTFSSNTAVSGTLQITAPNVSCGGTLSDAWSAAYAGPAPLDGLWKGTTLDGASIRFTVRRNTIVEPTVEMKDCGALGAISLSAAGEFSIANNAFAVYALGGQFGLTGSFSSNNTASGSVDVKGPDCHTAGAWSATKQ